MDKTKEEGGKDKGINSKHSIVVVRKKKRKMSTLKEISIPVKKKKFTQTSSPSPKTTRNLILDTTDNSKDLLKTSKTET